MPVGDVRVVGGIAMLSGGLGSYFSWVRRRNDAGRDVVLKALSDWLSAWSDLVILGTSSVLTSGRVVPVEPDLIKEALAALNRATLVCLITCNQRAVAQTGAMQIIAAQELVPLLHAGATKEEWQSATSRPLELQLLFVSDFRKT